MGTFEMTNRSMMTSRNNVQKINEMSQYKLQYAHDVFVKILQNYNAF